MHDDQSGDSPALTDLRRRLEAGRARMRLSKTDLAGRAALGRTTVSEAFQIDGPVPSAETVAALARALRLPVGELLELQRDAAGGGERPGPGRLIGEWEPHDLEVHPAGHSRVVDGSGVSGTRALPGYVRRDHDRVLDEAVRDVAVGRSRIVVLVGTSSTGKTRACWEAVQPLAERGWRLWHPFDPTRAEAALEDLHRVGPRTVVWLNEAQHYLGDRAAGERIAAAVHHLLVTPERGPVLVLGTLWPEYAHQYTALATPGGEDPYSRARELLSGRTLSIPDSFDALALAAAAVLAEGGDRLLADALTRTRTDGRIPQDLAGAPELLNRYQRASPAAKALLEAAMDARRLGVGLHLPQAFLTDAAPDYLSQSDYDQLTDDWAEAAFAELAEPVHGRQAPLRRTTPRPLRRPPTPSTATAPPSAQPAGPVFQLADYLEQHGRTTRRWLCPPSSFWYAAHTRLTRPDDLDNLAQAAERRHRLQWAHHLRHRAADHGGTRALYRLAEAREKAGDREGAETLARQAADHGDTYALLYLAQARERAGDRQGAETLYRQAADHGDTDALARLAEAREKAGDQEGAETLARQAADHGKTNALVHLALRREKAGDQEGAETLARQAADQGNTEALVRLAEAREKAGDQEGAETLARQAADQGNTDAMARLAMVRVEAGDRKGAETLARQAADHGNTYALGYLARERAGDREGAETLYRQAADHGDTDALYQLAMLREETGDREGAGILYRQAADHGDADALARLAEAQEEAGDWEGAETLARQAADHGNTYALVHLALRREATGDREGAETLARQAADHGNTYALFHLAAGREEAGDREGAETLARQGADLGDTNYPFYSEAESRVFLRLWPDGLDPDGTPTPRWQ
ncbi:tetratricopeptide repeat protein [Streptomyces sp. 5-8]|uniref:Tetratricopeptide repeat protein n=1 Tax=Streptomyces musisoli TaxID=2802280 RepID=A0ABS1PD15_9ACTN|nr:helix-turn-helix domain-containing protein [Streptomyces musisoli]MBL1109751.1 tetratricopeptide repeat protein [Streptomyces musisoli]